MSVFQVKLQNVEQGLLDVHPGTGAQMSPSVQRTIYVTGPRLTYRQLRDGQTFTDCNYWKKFAYPQVPYSQAFIHVVTDDGSVYSDVEEENTYALTFGGDTAYTVEAADTFATNSIDIMGTYGGFAKFVQITNYGTSSPGQDIKVQLNGSTSAVFNLLAGDTQMFNVGDLSVTHLAFEGGDSDTDIQVILSIKVQCTS